MSTSQFNSEWKFAIVITNRFVLLSMELSMTKAMPMPIVERRTHYKKKTTISAIYDCRHHSLTISNHCLEMFASFFFLPHSCSHSSLVLITLHSHEPMCVCVCQLDCSHMSKHWVDKEWIHEIKMWKRAKERASNK